MDVADESCSIIMGIPTKEWDDLPHPGLVFSHTSSHAVLKKILTQMNPSKRYHTTITMIPSYVWEIPFRLLKQKPVLIKIGVSLTISKFATLSSMANIFQTLKMLLMVNIYMCPLKFRGNIHQQYW